MRHAVRTVPAYVENSGWWVVIGEIRLSREHVLDGGLKAGVPPSLCELTKALLWIAIAGSVAICFGQDANWDLQNYHFYNAWAAMSGRGLDFDIAVAQLQTFHSPLADFPFATMVLADWNPRLITFVLAIPAGITFTYAAKSSPFFFRNRSRRTALALRTKTTVLHWESMAGSVSRARATAEYHAPPRNNALASTTRRWIAAALRALTFKLTGGPRRYQKELSRTPARPIERRVSRDWPSAQSINFQVSAPSK
jgi:hypothetical protein